MGDIDLIHGDCLAIMRGMPADSVDAVVTDPPAGISFMGAAFDHHRGGRVKWVAWLAERMAEALRLTRPGGYALVWAIPRTAHWTACALEDAGWQIRDSLEVWAASGPGLAAFLDSLDDGQRELLARAMPDQSSISHLFGQGYPKSKACLKPSHEQWWWVRKPLNHCEEIDIIEESIMLVEALLWSMSPARLAAECSGSLGAFPGGCSVRWLAVLLHVLSSLGRSDVMAMFSSPEAGEIFWSIAWSWSSILDASCSAPSTSITGTGSSLTIALRTLNSWLSGIIPASIMGAVTPTAGLWLDVGDVAGNSSGGELKSSVIPRPIAVGDVSWPVLRGMLNVLVSIAEGDFLPLRVERGSSVPLVVTRDIVPSIASPTPSPIVGSSRPNRETWWLCRKQGPKVEPLPGRDACRVRAIGGLTPGGRHTGSSPNPMNRANGIEEDRDRSPEHPAGRWPSNILMCHHPDCRPCGTRRVKGDRRDGGDGSRPGGFANVGADKGDGRPNGRLYGDADGLETVEDYNCVDECPVRQLDEMAGERKSGGSDGRRRNGVLKHGGVNGRPSHGTSEVETRGGLGASSGPVSRFYPTFAFDAPDFFPAIYCPKASRRDRGEGNTHPTTKPQSLMKWLVKLITPPGGTVLDPFVGSGTTLLAARAEGFSAIGIDDDAESIRIARVRLDGPHLPLFDRPDAGPGEGAP